MRSILIILFLGLSGLSAMAQKWEPGVFYDIKGTRNPGFIRPFPSGRGPLKNEAYIEYKDSEKAPTIKLSASDLRSFVASRDSFVVAAAPEEGWLRYELDFVRVAVDAPLRLFEARGGTGNDDSGSGVGIRPGFGMGVGGGGYGGISGGISIPIGGGGGRGSNKVIYFFGANTAEMKPITPQNFVDVMSEVMGDEPEVVEKLRSHKYKIGDMGKLLADFDKVQQSHKK